MPSCHPHLVILTLSDHCPVERFYSEELKVSLWRHDGRLHLFPEGACGDPCIWHDQDLLNKNEKGA